MKYYEINRMWFGVYPSIAGKKTPTLGGGPRPMCLLQHSANFAITFQLGYLPVFLCSQSAVSWQRQASMRSL